MKGPIKKKTYRGFPKSWDISSIFDLWPGKTWKHEIKKRSWNCQVQNPWSPSLMGKRVSNGSANPSKSSKNAAATLPSIPASSAKLPQLKIFEQWLTFVLKKLDVVHCFVGFSSNNPFSFFNTCSFWPRESVNNVHGTVDSYLVKKLESKDGAPSDSSWFHLPR